MRRKSPTLCSLFIVSILLLTGSYAWSALAVSTNGAGIFMLDSATGTSTNFTIDWGGTSPTRLEGVITKQGKMYVVDQNIAGPMLHVLEINSGGANPTARRIGNATLLKQGSNDLSEPSSIVMDGSGGLYVRGKNDYAYVNPQFNVSINTLSSTHYKEFSDIAAFNTGAVIIHQNDTNGLPSGESYASTVSGAVNTYTNVISTQAQPNYNPKAVAIHPNVTPSPLAYVLNNTYMTTGIWTVNVIDAGTSTPLASSRFTLDSNMTPVDITAFTTATGNYIGILAKNRSGTPQQDHTLWVYGLGTDGRINGNRASYNIPGTILSDVYRLEASANGEVLWIANLVAGTVDVLNTNTWLINPNGSLTASGINYLADWDGSFVIPQVPEPSSFIAFLTFATGMFGLARRRKR